MKALQLLETLKDDYIHVMFKKDFNSNYEPVVRLIHNTTKEMFDKAFEYFSTKDTNVK